MTTRSTAAAKPASQLQAGTVDVKDMTHAHIVRHVLNQNKGAVLNDTLVIGISMHIKELCDDLDKQHAALKAGAGSSKGSE